MRRVLVILFLLFFTSVHNLWGEGPPLNISQALRMAFQNNLNIKSKQSMLTASQLLKKAAEREIYPRLYITENYQRTNNAPMAFTHKLSQGRFTQYDLQLEGLNNPNPISNWHTELRLEQPVFNQGREYFERESGKLNLRLAELDLRREKELTALEVFQVYLALLMLDEELEALQKALEHATESERVARERNNAGKALYSDVLNASSHKALLQVEIENTRLRKRDAQRRLNQLLGLELDHEWAGLSKELPVPEPCPMPETEKPLFIERALSQRVDVAYKEVDLTYGNLNEKIAKYAFYPSLNLYGKYVWDSEDPLLSSNSYEMGFLLNWNLFKGQGDHLKYKAAKEAKEAKNLSLKNQRDLVSLEIEEAFGAIQMRFNEWGAALEDINRAEESLRILSARYKEGLSLLIEVLDAEKALKESVLRKARALFGFRAAWVRLQFSGGKILEVSGEAGD